MKKVLVLLLALSSTCIAQEKLSYRDNTYLQTNLDSLVKLKKHQDIVNLLNKVNNNDSIIDLVNVKKAYYNLQLEKFNDVIAICDDGIKTANSTDVVAFYINKAVALYKLNRIDDAIAVYDVALKRFPKNSTFYKRQGELYIEKGLYKEGYDNYKKAFLINPYNLDVHLAIGNMFYKEKKFTQALMVYNMYLLLLPDGDKSFSMLNYLNNRFSAKAKTSPTGVSITPNDDQFKEIDVLIDNRIALNKKYKIKNKLDVAYVKQNHLLFSMLDDIELSDSFFNKYYFSHYKWMIEQDKFDDFCYTTCYSIKNKKMQKVVSKNEKKVIAFYQLFANKFSNAIEKRIELFNGKEQEVYHSYEDMQLTGIGTKKNEKYNGVWEFYNAVGEITAKGAFDDAEERTGEWIWYYSDGTIAETLNYEKGLAEGAYKAYHKNGNLKIDCNYVNDKLEGNYKLYNRYGALDENKEFVKGDLDGTYESFYGVGKQTKKYEGTYKAGKLNGPLTQYYDFGGTYYEASFVNGNKEGTVNYFFANDSLLKTFNCVQDIITGDFKEFYANGKLYQEGLYTKGNLDGEWKLFFDDGKLKSVKNYKDGSYEGLSTDYSHLGHLYEEFEYKRNKLYKATYYDSKKNILYQEKKDNNKLNFKGYGVLANLKSEGLYNVKGGKDGLWKFYNRNGVLQYRENYIENELDGETLTYYRTGEIKSKTLYKKGSKDGYYVSYYVNGQMSSQGYYLEGNYDKEWRSYYGDGSIKNILYYHKGDLNGTQYYYTKDGYLNYTSEYKFGSMVSDKNFGPKKEQFIDGIDYEKIGNEPKEIIAKYFDGSVESKITYINGVAHGPAKYYYPTGQLFSEGEFYNGEYHKKWMWYYEDGTRYKEINYVTGTLHGQSLKYHRNGNLSSSKTFVLGEADGMDLSFAEDGKTVTNSVNFYNGYKNGETRFYSDKGELQLVRYYDFGILLGYSYFNKEGQLLEMIPIENETAKVVSYYKNGNKAREFEIKNGLFVNDYIEYYSNGKVERKSFFVNDDEMGEYTRYYENGQLSSVANYLMGNLQGDYKAYYSNGNLKEEYTYKNNVVTGAYSKYNKEGKLIEKGTAYNGNEFKDAL